MTEVQKWHYETNAKQTVTALTQNGFNAMFFSTGAEASDYIRKLMKKGDRIGIGGSATSTELGIPKIVEDNGAILLDHNKAGLSKEETVDIRRAQLTSDLFIASANAITLDGEIVNVDGAGNRIAALTFGPKKAIIIAGANKIVPDIESAFARIETTAAPMNVHRLNRNTPCAKTGKCEDCSSPERICRVYSIMKRKPSLIDTTVIIIGESLGF